MKIKNLYGELKAFLVLWSTQAISSLGTAMTSYALIVWVYGQQETASSVTLLTLCSFLPTILLRFIAGTLADRWDKRKTMLVCDALAGGFLADHVFEPFMQSPSPVQQHLAAVFGSESGAGMALLFCLAGIAGAGLSLACLWFSSRKKNT